MTDGQRVIQYPPSATPLRRGTNIPILPILSGTFASKSYGPSRASDQNKILATHPLLLTRVDRLANYFVLTGRPRPLPVLYTINPTNLNRNKKENEKRCNLQRPSPALQEGSNKKLQKLLKCPSVYAPFCIVSSVRDTLQGPACEDFGKANQGLAIFHTIQYHTV